jgi:anthranilate synthase/aminodeoxychorismate synthase-like glutamine amidotransferase
MHLRGQLQICFLAPMRLLFIENNDSFSWNVIDALPVGRARVRVVSIHDSSPACHPGLLSCHPGSLFCHPGRRPGAQQEHIVTEPPFALDQFDCLVIGPGPTDPIRAGIIDIVRQAADIQLPILGICLGHQAIGLAFGAQLVRTLPTHGKRSQIEFSSSRMFTRTLGPHTVMRYHSLSLDSVKTPLRVIAQTTDGIPMAIEHESLPIAGLQFHPDSYASPTGRAMLADFFEAIR